MKRRDFLVTAAILGCAPAWAAPRVARHQLLHVSFQCSQPLGKPVKVGVDAVSAKTGQFEVLVAEVGKEAFAQLKSASVDPFGYCKSTYLGISSPATRKSTRKVAGAARESEVYPDSFPHKDYLEVLWLERKEGAGVMLAFRVSKSMNLKKASSVIDQVCSSLEWKLT